MSTRTKAYIGVGVVLALSLGWWCVTHYQHVPVQGRVVEKYIDPESTYVRMISTSHKESAEK